MCNFEKIWLENCLRHFKPIIYRRFVDDTFSLLQSKEHVEKFRNYLNKQHKIQKLHQKLRKMVRHNF